MAYRTINYEVADHIATVTLNRPDQLNALTAELLNELAQALQEAEDSDKVRCIVITGSEKAFAAGADVKAMHDAGFVEMMRDDPLGRPFDRIARVQKPVIAAVSGYCLGGGCELAMACDMIIAADSARFGQPEVNLGIIAGLGGTQRLTRAIGKAKAMDMHLTGRHMDADEALRSGLVARVVPVKKLMEEAMSAAHKIAEKSQYAVMMAKEAVNRSMELPLAEGIRAERRLFASTFATEDRKEGLAAFLEKREPQFRDR